MELLQAIEAAFAAVPHPGENLLEGCHCDECRWSVSRFVGKDWRSLSHEDAVSDQPDAVIANLSPSAFRFFLPGLMRLAIQHEDEGDMIDFDIEACLTVSDASRDLAAELARIQRRLDLLNEDQRRSIIGFLEHLQAGGSHIPEVLRSASQNVSSGVARPYSQHLAAEWLREHCGYTG
jgi:hypothetical protein